MTVGNNAYLVCGAMWFALASQPVWADEDRAGIAEAETKELAPALNVQLAPPAGVENEKQHLDSFRKRVDEAATKAEAETDAMRKSKQLLAAANLVLAEEMAPLCTRRFLNVELDNQPLFEHAAASLDRADELISSAKSAIDSIAGDSKEEQLPVARGHVRTLDVFSKAIRCYLAAGSGRAPAANAREAASALSALLEDENPKLVASATFWQALLRSQDQPPERVLTILDLPLSDPSADSMPYSLYARMLRCQLVASRGGYATAYGLLLQMEEASIRWLKNDKDADDAMRTISLVEIQILQQWHDRLDATTETSEREWCQKRIETITKERLTGEVAVYRLSPAIPVLVTIE